MRFLSDWSGVKVGGGIKNLAGTRDDDAEEAMLKAESQVSSTLKPKEVDPDKTEHTEFGESMVRLVAVDWDFGCDPAAASLEIDMMHGRFAVEMCPEPSGERKMPSGLYLVSTDGGWKYRPDAGIVVAVAPYDADPETGRRASWPIPLRVGQAVVVDHVPGLRIEGAVVGNYESASEVRMYGFAPEAIEGRPVPYGWRKVLLLIEQEDGALNVGGRTFGPAPDWCLIARDGLMEKSTGGIYIPDVAKVGGIKGTIVQAGAACFGPDDRPGAPSFVKRGERYIYSPNLTKRDVRTLIVDSADASRLALVHKDALEARLNETVPESYVRRMVEAATVRSDI